MQQKAGYSLKHFWSSLVDEHCTHLQNKYVNSAYICAVFRNINIKYIGSFQLYCFRTPGFVIAIIAATPRIEQKIARQS